MQTILMPLLSEFVTQIVIPVLGAVLMFYGTAAAIKIRDKTGVDVTEKLNGLLNRALQRIAEGLVAKVAAGELSPSADLVGMAVRQLQQVMPDTVKKLGANRSDLVTVATNAIAREVAAKQ